MNILTEHYDRLEDRIMSPSVLITGCNLVDPSSNRIVHGDLWECGDTYFFNAVLSPINRSIGATEAAWEPLDLTPDQLRDYRIITIKPEVNFFERRGIILFPKAWGQLNTGALKYLKRPTAWGEESTKLITGRVGR